MVKKKFFTAVKHFFTAVKITASRKISLSIRALEISDEKEAIEQYGSKDSGASLGDILGEALDKNSSEKDSNNEGGND